MNDNQKQEMDRLISRIETHQKSLGLSHTRFATRFAKHVGSHKSWEFRLVARKWEELKPETWLPKLRKFTGEIDGTVGTQEIFASLPIVKHANYLFDVLQTKTNDRRCAILIGVQGTGKTLSLRNVERENNHAPAFMSANETWKDSRMRIAQSLAQAVNAPIVPSASQTFQNCIEVMKANPGNLLIDEAHEGGVLLIKLVKSIINETQWRVMLGIYPTAWRRLINGASDAYAEAQQLLRRTIRPIKNDWLLGINEEDMSAWCDAVKLEIAKSKIVELLPLVRKHGNYSLLADSLERATVLAAESGDEVSQELFGAQVRELCSEIVKQKEAA
jgi:hypothetical protein